MTTLTAYFDESGHAEDPACNFVGMAGFLAPSVAWEVFESQWQGLLDVAGLKEPFHMVDFAHSQGQFQSWKGQKEKRELFFRRLIQIIVDTGAVPIGASVSLRDFASLTEEQQSSFRDPYYLCFQTCTRGAVIQAQFKPAGEKVSMVYSLQPEFGTNNGGHAEQLWHEMKKSVTLGGIRDRMATYGEAAPEERLPLQAADVFAYELCHEFENRINRPKDRMRYGLRQILRMYRTPIMFVRMFNRAELLRLILESNMPDQTGVDEIPRFQFEKAIGEAHWWLLNRGEYDPGELF